MPGSYLQENLEISTKVTKKYTLRETKMIAYQHIPLQAQGHNK